VTFWCSSLRDCRVKAIESPIWLGRERIGTCGNMRFYGSWIFAEWIRFNHVENLPCLPRLDRYALDNGHAGVFMWFHEAGFCDPHGAAYLIRHVEMLAVP